MLTEERIKKTYNRLRLKATSGEKFYIFVLCLNSEIKEIEKNLPEHYNIKWELIGYQKQTKGYRWGSLRPNVLMTTELWDNIPKTERDKEYIQYVFSGMHYQSKVYMNLDVAKSLDIEMEQ